MMEQMQAAALHCCSLGSQGKGLSRWVPYHLQTLAAPAQWMACSNLHHRARLLPEPSCSLVDCAISCLTCTLLAAREEECSVTCIAVCTLDVSTAGHGSSSQRGQAACCPRSNGELSWPLAAWAGLSPLLSRFVGVPGEGCHSKAADLNSPPCPWRNSMAKTACSSGGQGASTTQGAACRQRRSAALDTVAGHSTLLAVYHT